MPIDYKTARPLQPLTNANSNMAKVYGDVSFVRNAAYQDFLTLQQYVSETYQPSFVVLPVSMGGTNSSAALNNNRVIISSGDAIVEAPEIANNRALASNGNGIPTSSTTTDVELSYLTGTTSQVQPQIDSKVPYTGATGDVDLGTYNITATKIIKSGGTSAQFLKADGSVDSATYGTGTVTSVGTTGLISGGPITTTGTVTTSMNTNKLVGRSTAGTGIMEEITVGTGLTLSGGTLSNTATPTPLGYYGAWQDDFTQTAAADNTGYPMSFHTADITPNGISIVNNGSGDPTRITFANTGIYNIQFGSQFQNTDNAQHDITIWLRLNGSDVSGSAGFISIPARKSAGAGNEGHIIVGWNYVVSVVGGQYYELVWSTSNHTHVTMQFYAAGSPPPSAASVILTVTQQSGIMSGTGITAINSLTGAVQTLTTGTAGTDFAIVDSGTDHQFNLPTASASNRGALSSTDWTTFNNKQNALGYTPVTNARTISTTAPLTGGGDLTANRTIAIPAATNAVDGYLTSMDWAIFNGKASGSDIAAQWHKAGNSGTTAGTDYVGTSDAVDLVLKTNATERLRVLSTGEIGVDVSPTNGKFEVLSSSTVNAQAGLYVAHTGAATVNYAGRFVKTGASTINYGLSGEASGATSNVGVFGNITGASIGSGVYGSNAATTNGQQNGVYASKSGNITTGTGYGLQASASGTAATNYGGYFLASGGTVNVGAYFSGTTYGLLVASNGTTGFGTLTPTARVHIQEPTLGSEVFRIETLAVNDDPAEQVYQGRQTTTSATVATVLTITPVASQTTMIEARVIARRTGGTAGVAEDGAGYNIFGTYKNTAGTVALIGAVAAGYTAESQVAWNATLVISGSTVLVQVTGAANNNITWHCTARVYRVGS